MSDKICIPKEDVENVCDKYLDEDRGTRALAYFIYTRLAEQEGLTFRERINLLKWVKKKFDGIT